MLRLLETFYRHRLILLIPLVVSTAMGVGVALNQPRTYDATANIWVDRTSIREIRPDNAYFSPADTQAGVFDELLTTRAFCVKAGRRGPLAAFIEDGQETAGYDPRLPQYGDLGWLAAQFNQSNVNQDRVNDLIFQSISKGARVTASGAEIVTVSFSYPDPKVAAGTLQALIDQFLEEVQGNRKAEARATADFYQQRAKGEETVLAQVQAKIYDYLAAHPAENVAGNVPSATLGQLRRDEDTVRRRYEGFLQKFDDAELTVAEVDLAAPNGFRLIDAPQTPTQPLGRLTNRGALAALGVGIALGLLISLAGLVILFLADRSVYRSEEVERELGLRVVASAPEVKGQLLGYSKRKGRDARAKSPGRG